MAERERLNQRLGGRLMETGKRERGEGVLRFFSDVPGKMPGDR